MDRRGDRERKAILINDYDPQSYDSLYPVVRYVGDETVQVEIRKAGRDLFFYGAVTKGTYADFIRWKAKQDATGPSTWDVLEDMRKAGCPGKVLNDLRGQLNATKALAAAKDFIASNRNDVSFLLLLGSPGIGKSVAAAYVMREHGKRAGLQGRDPSRPAEYRWIQASQLIGASNYGADAQWVNELERVRLLIVDELGADSASRAGKAKVTELLLKRHSRNAGTVLASNLSHVDFIEVYGQALFDRIRSNGVDPDLKSEKSLRKTLRSP